MGIIKLSELTFFTTLGIYEAEKINPVEIKIFVEIKSPKVSGTKFRENRIVEGIDYTEVYKEIQNVVEAKHHFLAEELATEINTALARQIKNFEYIKTRIVKPNPVVFAKGGFFEVEITLGKPTEE